MREWGNFSMAAGLQNRLQQMRVGEPAPSGVDIRIGGGTMAKILKFEPFRLKHVPIGLRWVRFVGPISPVKTDRDSGIAARGDFQQTEKKTGVGASDDRKGD
jgi:hypothetical protein